MDTYPKRQLKEMHPTQRILQAIKIAEAEHQADGPSSAITQLIEEIGILLGIMRRRRRESLDEFSARLNISPATLFALETGILSREKVCQVLPFAIKETGVSLNFSFR